MPIQKNEGILLRRQDLRETSLILTFYTRDFGKIKGIVRGVRGSRGQFGGGAFELFSKDEVIFYERKAGDIYTISNCELLDYFNPIRASLDKLSYAIYMVELLDSVATTNEGSAEIYDLLVNSLALLIGDTSIKRVARIYEIKLLSLLGLMPNLNSCAICDDLVQFNPKFSLRNGGLICPNCADTDKTALAVLPGTLKFMEYISSSPFDKAARIKVAAQVGRELETLLGHYLDYHLDRSLNSLKFIRQI